MVTTSMDMLSWLRKQLEEADVDLLREMVSALRDDRQDLRPVGTRNPEP